ncbi:MAG: small ribosomal subunit Rsm22 family protein [Chlamydiales bacterium]
MIPIDPFLQEIPLTELKEACFQLTENYLTGKWRLNYAAKIAYLAVRLPATLAVMQRIFQEVPKGDSLLDFGAGPGTSSYGTDIEHITHVEHDPEFIEIGKKLHSRGSWTENLPDQPHDIVLLSYSLGEIPARQRCDLLELLWERTKIALVVIEPGTPVGTASMLEGRERIIQLGGSVHAPCPHSQACPLQKPHWCHFSVKVERSALHRRLKEASLTYEEEKFAYCILTKEKLPALGTRILHTPQKRKGHINLTLCTDKGIEKRTISKRTKEAFRSAKKCSWGDLYQELQGEGISLSP